MLTKTSEAAIRSHAEKEFPRECCGVLIIRHGREKYIPCNNILPGNLDFAIDPEDYLRAEGQGQVIAIVHSHPNMTPEPSQADLVGCEQTKLPWIIISWPSGVLKTTEPSGYSLPYVGRPYHYGVIDCYTLFRDYYQRELGIELTNFFRAPDWWLKGSDMYNDHYPSSGFVEVTDEPRKHDVFLMQVFSPVINHAAIYIGDGMILQHCRDLLSSKDIMGGYWQRCVVKRIRHKDLL